MDQEYQELQRQYQPTGQEMTEITEQPGPYVDNNVDYTNNNTSSDIAQYMLVGDERRDNLGLEQEQTWAQRGQYPQALPQPQPQPPGSWQPLSVVPVLQQQQQLQQLQQGEEQQQLPLDSQDLNGAPLHRSKTCPPLDHEALLRLENNGQGYTTQESRLYGPHPFESGRFHSASGSEDEEPWDESTASCFARVRHRISISMETKTAHIVILLLTVLDIILVMLEIGASLLHLDETKEELWIIALFGHLSLAIISLFMVEILLKLFASGPRYFLPGTKHWFLHLLDALIILTSFLLEIFLKGAEQELTNLLIIFRLWRVVKLTGTVAIEVSEHDEQKIVILEQKVRELERELAFNQLKVQRLEAFNRGFQGQ